MPFNDNLLILRLKNNQTQAEVATALGLKRSTYSNYESGHSQPNVDTIVRIAAYFRVTTDELLSNQMSNVLLNEDSVEYKKRKNVLLNVLPNVPLNELKEANLPGSVKAMIVNERLKQLQQIIEAQQGQIEALKLAVEAMKQAKAAQESA